MSAMPIAHAGHWLVQVAYFLPVVGFLAWLAWTTLKERRRQDGSN
jgi:membrane protein implicated in regulation of membrane protease activity